MNSLIQKNIEEFLNTTVYDISIVNGGDINNAFLLRSDQGSFFVKTNQASFADQMFKTEVKGLELLADSGDVRVPKIIDQNSVAHHSYLLLEYIENGEKSKEFWENFGHTLAQLHRNTQDHFGLDHSNFIGTLSQSNNYHFDWPSFYIQERLLPQIELAKKTQAIDNQTITYFETLFKKLDNLCPTEPPSLIHGDLWSGNFLVDCNYQAVLIDPSVSFAHREMDIAMSRLFGGFSNDFYAAYLESYPLASGFEGRLGIYQLYYLMVHVNLFGGGYSNSVRSILRKFL